MGPTPVDSSATGAETKSNTRPRAIVGLGASAGGLRALEDFFGRMPPDSGCAFVVVQHLSPDFRSLMDDLLARHTQMRIQRAEEGLTLEANVVYLIPPKKLLTVAEGALHLAERPGDRPGDLPINVFFQSLARDAGSRAVAIVLSGTGSDGSEGVRAVHAARGLVIVQDPETAEFDGMPVSAVATGVADYVLSPAGMPEAILAYVSDPERRLAFGSHVQPVDSGESAGEFAPVFQLLKRSSGLDFSFYKLSTVERRIHRRAVLSGHPALPAYIDHLESHPAEVDQLYRDLLIGVTEFFRDPEAFEAIGRQVYEPLIAATGNGEVRVWIAGCATGEEAYTHAILLDEIARAHAFTGRISLFATDAHRHSLEIASAGVYAPERLALLSPERRERYFRPDKDGSFRIHPDLRQRIVFAPHNLLSDPPFTKIDVVSCRNLLIYLAVPAQERVISLLHYALKRGGAMLLGMSEGVGRLGADFEVLNAKHKIFRKSRESRIPTDLRSPMTGRPPLPRSSMASALPSTSSLLPRGLLHAYDTILARQLAPGYIINHEGEILHFIGDSARHLQPQSGRASENLLTRSSGELRLAFSTLLPKVLRRETPAIVRQVRLPATEGQPDWVDITFELLPEDRTGVSLIHVQLKPVANAAAGAGGALEPVPAELTTDEAQLRRIADLEQELLATKESLQASVEELQTTNEELQAANEEMLAANEELQSTNEELHSVNEELYTVNSEFERKNHELNQTVADLDNLLTATDAGTLFLDRELRIRRFNPAIQEIFKLIPQDVGRSIEHIAYHLTNQRQMIEDVQTVLQTGEPVEREVRTNSGSCLLKRTLPFLGANRSIEGAVLTFTRIDLIKEMQLKLDLAMVSSRLVWWEWDLKKNQLLTHSAGWCILGYEVDCLEPTAETWFKLVHPDDLERVRHSLDECLAGRVAEWDCEHRFRTRDHSWRWVLNKGKVSERDPDGRPLRMLGTTQDIDVRKHIQQEALQLRQAINQADAAIVITDDSGTIEFVNPAFCRVTGYTAEEALGQNPRLLRSDRTPPEFFRELWHTLQRGEVWRGVFENRRKNREYFWERASITPLRDENGRTTHYIAVKEDITAMRKEEEHRARLEHQLMESQKMETLGTLAGGIAHDFNNLLTGILGYARMAMEPLPADHPAMPALDSVVRTSQRAAELVRRMLAFSRHQAPIRSRVNLGKMVQEFMPILRSSVPTTIDIGFHNSAPDAGVIGDPAQLEQVIANLCTNAAQAIGSKVGAIQIDLSVVVLDHARTLRTGELLPGSYVRLIVADNGAGMDEKTLQRIFEPFFTTKPPGEGTGLGLSIVHTTVVTAGGGLVVNSKIGTGTEFTLYLPLAAAAPWSQAEVPPETQSFAELDLVGRQILVLDDEQFVSEPIKQALERAGAVVGVHQQPQECLAAILAAPEKYHVLITDHTMPVMTGTALARTLRERGWLLPVLLMSGFNRVVDAKVVEELQPCRFLRKPFEMADLLREASLLVAKDSHPQRSS